MPCCRHVWACEGCTMASLSQFCSLQSEGFTHCVWASSSKTSPPNLTHGTKKLPTWALQHSGNRTLFHWSFGDKNKTSQSFYEYECILHREFRGQSEVRVFLTGAQYLAQTWLPNFPVKLWNMKWKMRTSNRRWTYEILEKLKKIQFDLT